MGDFKNLSTPEPTGLTFLKLSYPAERVLLVTMSRPKALNSINQKASQDMEEVFRWFDEEPNLSVAVLTGEGRAFSAGADLKEWNASVQPGADPNKRVAARGKPFSRRMGKKPVIAAANGIAMGGGMEFTANCDLVIASEKAVFALPEVKRGLIPFAGVLPRIIRIIGLQKASEMVLTGRTISAQEAFNWGFVNKVVAPEQCVPEAVRFAAMIAENSPDAIIAARSGLRQSWETASVEQAADITLYGPWAQLQQGENMKEGLKAFTERRKPVWRPSRL